MHSSGVDSSKPDVGLIVSHTFWLAVVMLSIGVTQVYKTTLVRVAPIIHVENCAANMFWNNTLQTHIDLISAKGMNHCQVFYVGWPLREALVLQICKIKQ